MKVLYVENHWNQAELFKYSASLKLAWGVAEICNECNQVHPSSEACFSTDFSSVFDSRIADSTNKCHICRGDLPYLKTDKVQHLNKHTYLQNILGGVFKFTESSWLDSMKFGHADWLTLQ